MYTENSKVSLKTLISEGWVLKKEERLKEIESLLKLESRVKDIKITDMGVEFVKGVFNPHTKSVTDVKLVFQIIDREYDFRLLLRLNQTYKNERRDKVIRRNTILNQATINWSCFYSFYLHREVYSFGPNFIGSWFSRLNSILNR